MKERTPQKTPYIYITREKVIKMRDKDEAKRWKGGTNGEKNVCFPLKCKLLCHFPYSNYTSP